MGNWRTVQIEGKIEGGNAIEEIIEFLTVDRKTYKSKAYKEDGIYYLQFGYGVCGLGKWIEDDGKINVVGNLYERDCTIEELEEELKKLSVKFPSLLMNLHAGDGYESRECVCSFVVLDGRVEKVEPMVMHIDKIEAEQMKKNLLDQRRNHEFK